MAREEMKLIVNPVAANGTMGKRWPGIRAFLREARAEFTADLTKGEGHATELARQALADGYQTIVAVGGDGTVNEVVNGLIGENEKPHTHSAVTLGIIPGGTGSDLVRTIGIPSEHEGACRRLLRGGTRLIDLGLIEYTAQGRKRRRYFVNAAGLGLDGEIVERLKRSSKALGGTIPYLKSLILTLMTYESKDIEARFDDVQCRQRASSVIVCNGRYLAGGMHMVPYALLDDGLFDVVLLSDIGKLDLLANIYRVYRGTHLTHPKISTYRVKEVQIGARQRMLIQADGELIGEAPVTLRVIPRALQVRV